jgi:NAD+ kinase
MKQVSPGRGALYRRALLVWKKTALQVAQEENDERLLLLVAQNHPSVAKVKLTHSENEATVATIKRELARHGIDVTPVHRDGIAAALATGGYDIVITAGGDGTVLDVSHFLRDDIPVIGVNSAPSSSHGHWCIATMHNFGAILDEVISGRLKPLRIMRLRLTLDGTPLPELVLNEVLAAHSDIGGTSRYLLKVGKHTEEHKSDGLFVGAPGGCTGWMRSYGARVMPIASRRIQYLVRGLIFPPGRPDALRLKHALLSSKAKLHVTSQMPEGRLMIDGRHIKYDFPRGAELSISNAKCDLRLYIDAAVNERYYGAEVE